MALSYSYQLNSYIPEAQESLRTDFSLNPVRFALNQYVTIANVDKPLGYRTFIDPDEASRITSSDPELGALWADGSHAPKNFEQGQKFYDYAAKRLAEGFTIGMEQINFANYNVLASWANNAASRLMLRRTMRTYHKLDNASYPTGHSDTATVIGGGKWAGSSSTNNYIKKSLDKAYEAISKASNGFVSREDCIVVASTEVKHAVEQSGEFRDVYKNSPYANLVLNNGQVNSLGKEFYGMTAVWDGAIKNSAKKGQARSAAYAQTDTVYVIARPGSLQGSLNNMSGVTLAMVNDLTIQTKPDDFNKLVEGLVYDYLDIIVVPELVVRITDVI